MWLGVLKSWNRSIKYGKKFRRRFPLRDRMLKRKLLEFSDGLDDLFDIAHRDALQSMRINEDKEFLILQRQKGRPGCMAGVDMVLYQRQNRGVQRVEKELSRKRKHEQTSEEYLQTSDNFVMEEDAEDGTSESEVEELVMECNNNGTASISAKRGRKHFITPRLLSALDSAKVSDGKAMHILMATAEALGHCTRDLVVNRSTLHRLREEHRRKETQRIQESFIDKLSDTQAMVVHWDGKILPDLIGKIKVERIALLVSYNGESKFLGAPKLTSATGENIATAVFDSLSKWNIIDRVEGMSFDTTSTNTGAMNGACTQLQRMLGKNMLALPCRHHILEIYLRSVFDLHFKVTQAPEVSIFERFSKAWPNIDTSSFKSGLDCEDIKSYISDDICDDIKQFCHSQLQKTFVRADYEEFLRLVLTFLGDNGGQFKTPGVTSHARWMSKGIYSLKIFLFRDQFHFSKAEFKGLSHICVFLVRLYIKAWFKCSNAITSPLQDLNFLKACINYEKVNPSISSELMRKMQQHMWYLSEENIAMAFFDFNVSVDVKKKMVENLKREEPTIKLQDNRKIKKLSDLIHSDLNEFVSKTTLTFFIKYKLSTNFLYLDPESWETNEQFQKGHTICRNLLVTNDTAERGIKFIKDFNTVLTNKEEEKQFLLQVVEEYKKEYKSYKKSELI